jgi:hypothetical protein
MEKIFDMVQTLVNNLQPTMNPSSGQPWATYGMHNNYTPVEDVSNEIPSLENISIQMVNAINTSNGVSNGLEETTSPRHAEEEAAKKYKVLDKRLKAIEGFRVFRLDALDTYLDPDVVVALKF